jgi:transcriptional regulator with XRE-family HTH domain
MSTTTIPHKKIHQGRNVKRFREMLGVKQESLAFELGDDWNQKKVSLLEQKENIEADILAQISTILKIPVEAIQNFDEEQAINIISNTASFDNCQQPAFFNHNPTFNPLDKLIEAFEEIKRLNAALLKEKDEKIALLEKLLEKK